MSSTALAKDNGSNNALATFSRKKQQDDYDKIHGIGMSTFQTRPSRESSKNNILGSLNEFYVSSKSINHKVGDEMRR